MKNYHQLARDKHLLHEQLKKHQCEQIKHEKQEDVTKHDINRLQTKKERLSDDLEKYLTKINQLTQINQTKDKEVSGKDSLFRLDDAHRIDTSIKSSLSSTECSSQTSIPNIGEANR